MIDKPSARIRLASNVLRIRKAMGLTQVQMADRSGVPQGTISRLEKGLVLPNPADLYNLAECLNTSIDVLLKAPEQEMSPVS